MNRRADSPWEDRELALLSRDELEDLARVRSAELENVMDAMVDLLLKLDAEGRIELANAAVETTLGYDPDAIIGQPIDALLASGEETEREMVTADEFATVLFDSGQVPDIEVAFSTAEGVVIPMSLSTSVIHATESTDDPGGTVGEESDSIDGFVCVAKNVSDRIQRERVRQRKNEQLELLNQLVSHDIRNDVDLILDVVRKIRREGPPAGEQIVLEPGERKNLEAIGESGHRIVDITETARNLTLTIAELDEQSQPVPLADVLRREIVNASTLSPDATVEIDGDIPSVTVQANEMLGSVFRNLLTNAIKHNDKDEPLVTVSVAKGERTVTVRIADNGPGLPETKKRELDAGAIELPDGRSGSLGLYIVGTLLQQYGGSFSIEDNEPVGTVFEVTLKRVEG